MSKDSLKGLTQARLKELLHYDPTTGVFVWLKKSSSYSRVEVGSVAGNECGKGYRQIKIDGSTFKAHRLAWFYIHGNIPETDIDHRNGVTGDNRILNLRPITHQQNNHNQALPPKHNVSGLIGASWNGNAGKWQATIRVDGKNRYLGLHSTPELAHAAYLKAKDELHPTHLRLRGEA